MQVSRRQKVEVVINGAHKATNGSAVGRLRPLTVDEALPYSPLTTSVTSGYGTGVAPRYECSADRFSLERIPLPDLGQPHYLPGLLAETELTSTSKLFDQDTKTGSKWPVANSQVDALRKSLNDVLDPDDLSEL